MSILRDIGQTISRLSINTDIDGPFFGQGAELEDIRGQEEVNTVLFYSLPKNVVCGALYACNAIPGLSQVSGIATMVFAGLNYLANVAKGTINFDKDPDLATQVTVSCTKMASLGAAAVFAPGVGNIANGAAAIKEGVDTAVYTCALAT